MKGTMGSGTFTQHSFPHFTFFRSSLMLVHCSFTNNNTLGVWRWGSERTHEQGQGNDTAEPGTQPMLLVLFILSSHTSSMSVNSPSSSPIAGVSQLYQPRSNTDRAVRHEGSIGLVTGPYVRSHVSLSSPCSFPYMVHLLILLRESYVSLRDGGEDNERRERTNHFLISMCSLRVLSFTIVHSFTLVHNNKGELLDFSFQLER